MYQSVGPSRPAPAPPPPPGSGNPNPHRYTPTTNWDDSPFDTPSSELPRKVPPPRPPPPRVQPSPVEATTKGKGLPFKKATPQSVNILSNLFGSRSVNSKAATGSGPKLPPPPATLKKHHQYQVTQPQQHIIRHINRLINPILSSPPEFPLFHCSRPQCQVYRVCEIQQ